MGIFTSMGIFTYNDITSFSITGMMGIGSGGSSPNGMIAAIFR
jgi:hypothetical protein